MSEQVWIALIAALPPTLAGLAALVASLRNGIKADRNREDLGKNTLLTTETNNALVRVEEHTNGEFTRLKAQVGENAKVIAGLAALNVEVKQLRVDIQGLRVEMENKQDRPRTTK